MPRRAAKATASGSSRHLPSRVIRRTTTPRIVRVAGLLGRQIPPEERRALPPDLSKQLDHYIYGTPKR